MSEWNWMGVSKVTKGLALAVVCILSVRCSLPTPTEVESRIFRTMIQTFDFPQGWRRGNMGEIEVEGATSRAVSIRGPANLEQYAVLVTHIVSIYDSAEAAREAYPGVSAQNFPTSAWAPPEGFSYESSTADEFALQCMSVRISGVPAESCKAVARYGDIISVLYANVFEGRWFTWEDLERVLRAIDQRAAAQRLPSAQPKTSSAR
jgi:hypothetical protein